MKSDKQIWWELGQSMRAAQERKKVNEREQQHINQEHDTAINPAIGPKLRELLEKARGGK